VRQVFKTYGTAMLFEDTEIEFVVPEKNLIILTAGTGCGKTVHLKTIKTDVISPLTHWLIIEFSEFRELLDPFEIKTWI
jgi:ABC-type proline/glycine betaine transport system ATPase subunit